MQTSPVSAAPALGIDGNLFGSSGIDTTLYVQLLLVNDYDGQMKDAAKEIRISSKLKEAYRTHKVKINALLAKPKDKDGKIELNQEELTLLNSKPFFSWDKDANQGTGGVQSTFQNGDIKGQNSKYETVDNSKGPIIATNEQARVEGDPHFFDPDMQGGHWDFQGIAGHYYNYLTDTNLQVSAQHKQAGGNTTVIDNMRFTLDSPGHTFDIRANANGTVTVDGQALTNQQTLQIPPQGSVQLAGNQLTVITPEYIITASLNGGNIDAQFATREQGVWADGRAPTGLVGQQFDEDKAGVKGTEQQLERTYNIAAPAAPAPETVKVEKDAVEGELERISGEIDNINGNGEMISLTLQQLTNQRKTAFETVSNILSKSGETANNIARNIAR